jgi:DNA-binding NarL/FixJ family response regulator
MFRITNGKLGEKGLNNSIRSMAEAGYQQQSALSQRLTTREWEVLKYLSDGLEYQEIATILGIGINGIRAHIKNIYRKLQVTNNVQAARLFWEDQYLPKRRH